MIVVLLTIIIINHVISEDNLQKALLLMDVIVLFQLNQDRIAHKKNVESRILLMEHK